MRATTLVDGTPEKYVENLAKARIYFERNNWLTIPFSDMRSVLGMNHDQAEYCINALKREGFIKQVAYSKYRCQPKINGRTSERNESSTRVSEEVAISSKASSTDLEKEEKEEKEVAPYALIMDGIGRMNGVAHINDADGKRTRTSSNVIQSSFREALEALKKLHPTGATAEELFELIERKGSFYGLRKSLHDANEYGWTRNERGPGIKNKGRGYSMRHFWVCDPPENTRTISTSPLAAPSSTPSEDAVTVSATLATSIPERQIVPVENTVPTLLSVPTSAPAHLNGAITDFNRTYIEVIQTRRAEILTLLQSIEPLQQELQYLEGVLRLHGN